MVDKLDKTSSDEEFLGAMDKYTEEFRKQNGINLYQDEFIHEEFLPQQETFKNIAQQAFGAQKLQFIREQRDASFSIEVRNIFSDASDEFENTGGALLGVNSLSDLLNTKEDIITKSNIKNEMIAAISTPPSSSISPEENLDMAPPTRP